jgi:predicted nucleic acid-binding protein
MRRRSARRKCFGIALLPSGRRRDELWRAVQIVFASLIAGRVLPFESTAAACFEDRAADRRLAAKPVGMADLQIAAIAQSRNAAAIATRNTKGFAGCGVPLVDPVVYVG